MKSKVYSFMQAEKNETRNKVCCFTGHRPQSLPFGFDESDERCKRLKELLRRHIVELIEKQSVLHFISGMALGVDLYAAQIVLDEKKRYPAITLECALPCETQSNRWSDAQRELYYNILARCDKTTLLQRRYTPECMQKRNRYMVDQSDYVLAVWNGSASGTGQTVSYARERKKAVIVIDPNGL